MFVMFVTWVDQKVLKLIIRGLSEKFADTANKTWNMYPRLKKFCIYKYEFILNMTHFFLLLTDSSVMKQSRGILHAARHKFMFILLSQSSSNAHQIHKK